MVKNRLRIHGSQSISPGTASLHLPLNEHGKILPVTSHVAVPASLILACVQGHSRHLRVYSKLAAPPLLSDTQTASGTITKGKGSRLAAALI